MTIKDTIVIAAAQVLHPGLSPLEAIEEEMNYNHQIILTKINSKIDYKDNLAIQEFYKEIQKELKQDAFNNAIAKARVN